MAMIRGKVAQDLARVLGLCGGKDMAKSASVKRGKAQSKLLEESLQAQCRIAGLPVPRLQFQFAPPRRFAADLAWPDHRLLMEIQGGIYLKHGAHNTGAAITRDTQKAQLAVLRGYTLVPVTPSQVRSGEALAFLREALAARHDNGGANGEQRESAAC